MAILIDDMEVLSNGDLRMNPPQSNVVSFAGHSDGLGMPLVLTTKIPQVVGGPSNDALGGPPYFQSQVAGSIGATAEESKSSSFFSSRNVLLAISGLSAAVLLITLFSPSKPKRQRTPRHRRASNRK